MVLMHGHCCDVAELAMTNTEHINTLESKTEHLRCAQSRCVFVRSNPGLDIVVPTA